MLNMFNLFGCLSNYLALCCVPCVCSWMRVYVKNTHDALLKQYFYFYLSIVHLTFENVSK